MNDPHLSIISQILHSHLPLRGEIFLFGSRARGDHKKNADYDIGINAGYSLGWSKIEDLKNLFLEFPRYVDIVDFSQVSESFKKEAMKDIKKM